MKRAIYETKGRAREFNELAINLFTGCGHQCIYCYGADITHQDRWNWENKPLPRVTLADIEHSAASWQSYEFRQGHKPRRILLCFVTDPYQPVEDKTQLTRKTIQILHNYGLNVVILTKAGKRAMRDFDLLTPQDAFATSLTCDNSTDSLKWEPFAALPANRIENLKESHRRGIETWVSLEPVIYPDQVVRLIEMTKGFVGHYKVGTMNYHPHGKSINWRDFGWRIKRLMDIQGINYYFKQDLIREMGISPAQFRQTFVCK